MINAAAGNPAPEPDGPQVSDTEAAGNPAPERSYRASATETATAVAVVTERLRVPVHLAQRIVDRIEIPAGTFALLPHLARTLPTARLQAMLNGEASGDRGTR